jgi:hypothetical protein
LTDNLTTSSNVSEVVPSHLDKRQAQILFTKAGLNVVIANSASSAPNRARKCTLGFAIKKDVNNRQQNIDHGFLILGSCLSSDQAGISNSIFHVRPTVDPDRPEVIRVGLMGSLSYVRLLGLNFALVRLTPNTVQRIL